MSHTTKHDGSTEIYTDSVTNGRANAIFREIRNTPLDSLNTEGFRNRILECIQKVDSGESQKADVEQNTHEDTSVLTCNYHVHFLGSPSNCGDGQAAIYSFSGFPGLYLVRNYFTPHQCKILIWKTLTEYINPPNNSNLLQHSPDLAGPLWPSSQFKKLKWATIGHMYDWGTRSYRGYSEFPQLLVDISQNLLSHFGKAYLPDAAIINCYSGGYFLRLHKDDAEETDDSVLNISLGAPAIFLVGGHDQSTIPVSMVVESGSVVVMAEDSRFCLHGIAKLLNYNKPGYSGHSNINVTVQGTMYAEPILEKIVQQCPSAAFHNIFCESSTSETIESLESDLRVSVSIRRAKGDVIGT